MAGLVVVVLTNGKHIKATLVVDTEELLTLTTKALLSANALTGDEFKLVNRVYTRSVDAQEVATGLQAAGKAKARQLTVKVASLLGPAGSEDKLLNFIVDFMRRQ